MLLRNKIKFLSLFIVCNFLILSCQDKKEKTTQTKNTGTSAVTTDSGSKSTENPIVYVNIDTLMENYQYFKDSQKKLEGQFEASQKEIDGKLQALQQKFMSYQQRAQEMTRQQLEEAERTLGGEQEQLMKRKDQLSKNLVKAEEDLNLKLKDKINDYLEKLAKENGYKFILSYNTTGLGMLYGDKSLEITEKVLTDLNAAYKAEKGGK